MPRPLYAFPGGLYRILLLVIVITHSQVKMRAERTESLEAEVKATFLMNFIKFTEWPVERNPSDSIVLCAWSRNDVGNSLQKAVNGQKNPSRTIELRRVENAVDARACQVLYIAGDDLNATKAFLHDPATREILTIGEDDRTGHLGTLLNFAIEDQRVVFAFHPD